MLIKTNDIHAKQSRASALHWQHLIRRNLDPDLGHELLHQAHLQSRPAFASSCL